MEHLEAQSLCWRMFTVDNKVKTVSHNSIIQDREILCFTLDVIAGSECGFAIVQTNLKHLLFALSWLYFAFSCINSGVYSTLFSLFFTFFAVAPWSLCGSPNRLPQCQACVPLGQAPMHHQGQTEALPADALASFNLSCRQPWLWLWHAWPDRHLTHRTRKTLAAALRRNHDHNELSSFLLLFHAVHLYVPFSEATESCHKSPASLIAGQFVVPHLQVRTFKER